MSGCNAAGTGALEAELRSEKPTWPWEDDLEVLDRPAMEDYR